MSLVKKAIHKLIDIYRRQNRIKYAKSLGVTVGENCRFVWPVHRPSAKEADYELPHGHCGTRTG